MFYRLFRSTDLWSCQGNSDIRSNHNRDPVFNRRISIAWFLWQMSEMVSEIGSVLGAWLGVFSFT